MADEKLSCPSARSDMDGAQIIGVVERGSDGHRVAYVNSVVPVTDDVLQATGQVPPELVYRFAAPCAEKQCTHFDGVKCQLATRIAENLAPAVDKLPPCVLRKSCRWFLQEGGAACARCPEITTRVTDWNDPLMTVATPSERQKAIP